MTRIARMTARAVSYRCPSPDEVYPLLVEAVEVAIAWCNTFYDRVSPRRLEHVLRTWRRNFGLTSFNKSRGLCLPRKCSDEELRADPELVAGESGYLASMPYLLDASKDHKQILENERTWFKAALAAP